MKPRGSASLPRSVRADLSALADALRDLPRDCLADKAELCHWLNGLARRVERIRDVELPKSGGGADG
ncbi:hypothetical protein [Lichenibacterium dinghuense]|uniref:hypothetical protein n=1 Tax=Lichenibacterium dinghuense TaxID=2895977 RepID=UPI001F3C3E87|nr:hypothetical protein [Lichenibacterium sp. 6Y81]